MMANEDEIRRRRCLDLRRSKYDDKRLQIESLKVELNSLNAMLTTSVTVNRNNDESNSEVLDQTAEADNSLLQCSTPSKPSVSFSISPPQKIVHNSSSKGSFLFR